METLEKRVRIDDKKSLEVYNRLDNIYKEIRKEYNKEGLQSEKVRYADIGDYIIEHGLDDKIHLEINDWITFFLRRSK